MINYSFKTELTKERTIYTDIVFTTGDIKGYRLNFSFTENKKPVCIKNHILTVKAKRSDGVIITDAGIVKDDYTAYIDIKNSMISKSGEVSFEIALSDNTGMYVTTKELIANVRKGYGEEGITPTDTAPVLSSLLTAASTLAASASSVNEAVDNANKVTENITQATDKAQHVADNINEVLKNTGIFILTGTLGEFHKSQYTSSESYYDIIFDKTFDEIENAYKEGKVICLRLDEDGFCYQSAMLTRIVLQMDGSDITQISYDGVMILGRSYMFGVSIEETTARMYYATKIITEEKLNKVIGDIETSLDNIIEDYGIGGDSV